MGKKKEDFDPFKLTARQALALGAIGFQDSYGLQVAKAIKEATNGKVDLAMGALYPILHTLEDRGLVESYWGDETPEERQGARRRYYKLTGAGRRVWNEYNSAISQWAPAMER